MKYVGARNNFIRAPFAIQGVFTAIVAVILTITIVNIDKTAPSLNVSYSTTNPTKENVKVTITSNEEVQDLSGWTISNDKKTLTKE